MKQPTFDDNKKNNQTIMKKKQLGMVKKVGFVVDSFDFLEKGKVIPMDKEIIDDSDSDDADNDDYNNKREEENKNNEELVLSLHKYDWIIYYFVLVLISFIIIGTIVRIFVIILIPQITMMK